MPQDGDHAGAQSSFHQIMKFVWIYISVIVAVTRTSKGDIPIHPNKRDARSPLKVVMYEAQREEMNKTRLPPRNTGRLPNLTASPFVTKHDTPMRKIPHPSFALRSL